MFRVFVLFLQCCFHAGFLTVGTIVSLFVVGLLQLSVSPSCSEEEASATTEADPPSLFLPTSQAYTKPTDSVGMYAQTRNRNDPKCQAKMLRSFLGTLQGAAHNSAYECREGWQSCSINVFATCIWPRVQRHVHS